MNITISPRFKRHIEELFKVKFNLDISNANIFIGKTGIIAGLNDNLYVINYKDI